MTAYYNEINQHKAETLRQLIAMGEIAPGDVDERSIEEVKPDDIRVYTQHHFFAGAGGWSLALRNAGWPDNRPVWTGSTPCQSFSASGKQRGRDDERHLWPHWFRLINSLRPTTIFGEQVSSAIKHGWLDEVCGDLRSADYSCWPFILPAQVVAEHKRDRLFFVAHTASRDSEKWVQSSGEYGRLSQDVGPDWTQDRWTQTQESFRGLGKAELVNCRDGKQRLIKSGVLPMVNGLSTSMVPSRNLSIAHVEGGSKEARLDLIHMYGDAIQVQLATLFIRASMEVLWSL